MVEFSSGRSVSDLLSPAGAEEAELEVVVVASQLRGYGVWDGSLAGDGSLLAGRRGPAPSLLFLWVSDAQANLLQMELSAVQTAAAAAGKVGRGRAHSEEVPPEHGGVWFAPPFSSSLLHPPAGAGEAAAGAGNSSAGLHPGHGGVQEGLLLLLPLLPPQVG